MGISRRALFAALAAPLVASAKSQQILLPKYPIDRRCYLRFPAPRGCSFGNPFYEPYITWPLVHEIAVREGWPLDQIQERFAGGKAMDYLPYVIPARVYLNGVDVSKHAVAADEAGFVIVIARNEFGNYLSARYPASDLCSPFHPHNACRELRWIDHSVVYERLWGKVRIELARGIRHVDCGRAPLGV